MAKPKKLVVEEKPMPDEAFPKDAQTLYGPDDFVWLNDVTHESYGTPAMRLSNGEIISITPGLVQLKAAIGLRRFVVRQREDGLFEETGEEITLDAFRDELPDALRAAILDGATTAEKIEKALGQMSPRARLEYHVFRATVDAHVPNNGWNFTWPHLRTELLDTPKEREMIAAALHKSMAHYPNDFQVLGVQRRYLLYFADSSPSKQRMYVNVANPPEGDEPFDAKGDLKPHFAKDFTPKMYEASGKAPDGQPMIYRGPAWVVRFLLDGQSVAFGNCRVYVGEGDHPGFTESLLPIGQFYCSDWCQRHDYTSYGKGINLQFADFTFDGWVMGACMPYAMTAGAYTPPPNLKAKSSDVRDLIDREKEFAIPTIEEIVGQLRQNRPIVDLALADLPSPIADRDAAVRQFERAILLAFKEGRIGRMNGVPMILSPSVFPIAKAESLPTLKPLMDEAGLVHIPLSDPRECASWMGPLHQKLGVSPEERMKRVPLTQSCILTDGWHVHPEKIHLIPDIPAIHQMAERLVEERIEMERAEMERVARERAHREWAEAERPEQRDPGAQEALPFGKAGSDTTPDASRIPALDADVVAMADMLAANQTIRFFPAFPGEDGYVAESSATDGLSPDEFAAAVAEAALEGSIDEDDVVVYDVVYNPASHWASSADVGPVQEGLVPADLFYPTDRGLRINSKKFSALPTLPPGNGKLKVDNFIADHPQTAGRVSYVEMNQYDHASPTIAVCKGCKAIVDCRAGAMLDAHGCLIGTGSPRQCLAAAARVHPGCVARAPELATETLYVAEASKFYGDGSVPISLPQPIRGANEIEPLYPSSFAKKLTSAGFSLDGGRVILLGQEEFCETPHSCSACKSKLAGLLDAWDFPQFTFDQIKNILTPTGHSADPLSFNPSEE